MGEPLKLTGIIISAAPIGEYDKRLVLLTKEKGKISAFVKGARKPNSPFLAASQPLAFGEFIVYVGRSTHNIVQMNITNYFQGIRDNIEKIAYGFYLCEFTNYMTKEEADETEMLKLLYVTLLALDKDTIDDVLIRYIFELKALVINGLGPQVFECIRCGNEQADFFIAEGNGLFCDQCNIDRKVGHKINASTKYTLQYIVSSSIQKLYTFQVSDEVLNELGYVMRQYIKQHIEFQFKSLALLSKSI